MSVSTGAVESGKLTDKKWVYLFHEGSAEMRDLLGGKGAGLSEMTNAGLPVPPGFTITTEACNAYYAANETFADGFWEQVQEAIQHIEQNTGKRFGNAKNPLLVSVRSGAKFSMPGMMDTVLNLGLNEDTLQGLLEATNDSRFAFDTYRRFIQMFSKIVLEIGADEFEGVLEAKKREVGAKGDNDLDGQDMQDVVLRFKRLVLERSGTPFPTDPQEQLFKAIRAVFASWNNKRAIDYRNFNNIPHNLGTGVNIVAMVFGNLGKNSGTGVAFTRNPANGTRELYGEFLANAQGEDVVGGIRTPEHIDKLAEAMPEVYRQFAEVGELLETHYRDAQDLEFTVEQGKLYMLQTRSAKRTAQAAIKMAVDMVEEGLITRDEALQRVEPSQVSQILLPRFDEKAKEEAKADRRLLATGLNASPGGASGKVVFSADRAEELAGELGDVILVRPETSPDDMHGMLASKGVLTGLGGATSHAAVVARGMGLPCVVGAQGLEVDHEARQFSINGLIVREQEEISIDGTTGEIFLGRIPTIEPRADQETELMKLLLWADEVRTLGVWANADTPRDAQRARDLGAEGIGLCRTEHMFFGDDRLPIMRRMILAAAEATSLEEDIAEAHRNLEQISHESQREIWETRIKDLQTKARDSRVLEDYHGSLKTLLKFQTQDFSEILQVMESKPVIIRLLDPPLHEFLPSYEELLEWVTALRATKDNSAELREKEKLLGTVSGMREANPMLGLRGCRLGLMYPAINEMQVRAIFTAACDLVAKGIDARPEVMIPLVGHVNELKLVRDQLELIAEEIQEEKGVRVHYKFGTMIEVPRAALTANEIARHADFFSFGTNDLTQTTFGYSRDDAEGKFLLKYIERNILENNPFQTLDQAGVGKLMSMAVEQGKRTEPNLEIGICGEHGGDPASIAFCHELGLDYVSCSPFRVPVARLAAAQAALGSVERDK
jgi:pyruvate,orthophosphate dikinase